MPGANQILFAPNDPNVVLLRATFGILISHDAGVNWDWLCESAIPSLPNQRDPMLGITSNGTLVATVFPGVDVTPDLGCTWNAGQCPLGPLSVLDLAVRPDAPHSIL